MSLEGLERVVEQLQRATKVTVLSGAGMSTAAGIPDFRSAGGLYGNSAALLDRFTFPEGAMLPSAWQKEKLEDNITAALTHEFFQVNPLPYHEMRRGMIIGFGLGQWKLTLGHAFPEILNRKGKLRLLASQNIDGLDHKVVSDKQKLYNPHGLMSYLVSEPVDEPLCTDPNGPIYQKYVELVKTCVKDIYEDRPPRQGKSSHLWPGPKASVPITLDMFGDLLPERFHEARNKEKKTGSFSVKPGSVLFDRTLWQTNAAGEKCDAFGDVGNCDMMLVMGTSLSGLTIDDMAHLAAKKNKPIVVFDMTDAPVKSLRGGWDPSRDSFLQGPIDQSLLEILHKLGWLTEVLDFLEHLCLGSLKLLREFAADPAKGLKPEDLARIDAAIAQEIEREKAFYGE